MIALGLLVLALLVPPVGVGTVRVKTDVAEVRVLLDGREVGATPLTIGDVAVGTHRLALVKEGYETHEETVQVQEGTTTKTFVVMRRSQARRLSLPAHFRVFHQHTSGHCAGELQITAEAVDYRADDGKDVFHIPVASIKSVSRSTGQRWERLRIEHAGDDERKPLACRVETAEQAYGFWAYEGDAPLASANPREPTDVQQFKIGPKTRELFDILYQLWIIPSRTVAQPPR